MNLEECLIEAICPILIFEYQLCLLGIGVGDHCAHQELVSAQHSDGVWKDEHNCIRSRMT